MLQTKSVQVLATHPLLTGSVHRHKKSEDVSFVLTANAFTG
jgi:hypothetical protein